MLDLRVLWLLSYPTWSVSPIEASSSLELFASRSSEAPILVGVGVGLLLGTRVSLVFARILYLLKDSINYNNLQSITALKGID